MSIEIRQGNGVQADIARRGLLVPAWKDTDGGIFCIAVVASGEYAGLTVAQVAEARGVALNTARDFLLDGHIPPQQSRAPAAPADMAAYAAKHLPPDQRKCTQIELANLYGLSQGTVNYRIKHDIPLSLAKGCPGNRRTIKRRKYQAGDAAEAAKASSPLSKALGFARPAAAGAILRNQDARCLRRHFELDR